MKKAICLLLAIVFAIGCVGCANNGSAIGKRTDFDIEYSADGMENFLKIVCKNVDGDAMVIDAIEGGDYYYAQAEIKLAGKVSELAEMRFYNSDDSDVVSWVEIIINDSDTENQFNCEKELIMACERALVGKATADQYITTSNDMYNLAFSNDWDPVLVAEYELKDNLYAVITAVPFYGYDWAVRYRVYTESEYQKWYVNSLDYR